MLLVACREQHSTAMATPPSRRPAVSLELTAVLPIEAPEHFQPSGLALDGEHLLVVSDHDDTSIYELELGEAVARARPHLTFSAPGDVDAEGVSVSCRAGERLDFEGLARVGDGLFWILSEGCYRVLEVAAPSALPGVGHARWLSPSVERIGRAAGLFQVRGGDVEGLARLPGGGLLIAAERQPRALIELPPDFALGAARVWPMPEHSHQLASQRPPDFTDLTLVGGEVFALVRNAHAVVRLVRTDAGWREDQAWTYAAVENDPRFVYADPVFGLGEGLAVSEREVFVVLDNNEQARAAAPADRRALLLRFRRPPQLGSAE